MSKLTLTISDAAAPLATEAARILAERAAERDLGGALNVNFAEEAGAGDGFKLDIKGREVSIRAGKTREFIAAAGRLLDMLRKSADEGATLADASIVDIPKHPVRVHYMPGHFGNSFEVAWPGEMKRYLEDLALAGTSGYGDWFDPNDMPDPYNPHVYCSTSMSLWSRKKEFLRIAKKLGLETILTIAHNVGFTDQMRPEWVGKRDHTKRVQGQVLCPSIPEARAVALNNHENLFSDLERSGVVIDRLLMTPYDDGGCACDKCQPYYPTFLPMVMEIYGLAAKHFPAVKVDMCGWWASDDEMQQLRDLIDRTPAEWFHSFQYSATYGVFGIPADIRDTLGEMPLTSFTHIAFSHEDKDTYNYNGIHSAVSRIKSIIGSFARVDCLGFCSYNETFGDHLNEYAASRLGRDPDLDERSIVEDYCRQMYGLRGEDLADMTALLLDMEMLEYEKAEKWTQTLERLRLAVKTPPRQTWAFEQVALKAELMALDHKIGSGGGWESRDDIAPVLPIIKKRLELSEVLWRDVYGFGVLRHIFIPLANMPEWYKNYAKLFPAKDGAIRRGAQMSPDA